MVGGTSQFHQIGRQQIQQVPGRVERADSAFTGYPVLSASEFIGWRIIGLYPAIRHQHAICRRIAWAHLSVEGLLYAQVQRWRGRPVHWRIIGLYPAIRHQHAIGNRIAWARFSVEGLYAQVQRWRGRPVHFRIQGTDADA